MQKEEKKIRQKDVEIAYNSVFIHSRKCWLFLLDFFTNLVSGELNI